MEKDELGLETPHHHSLNRMMGSRITGDKIGPMVAAVHKKKKNPKIEAAKKGIRRWIPEFEAMKIFKDHPHITPENVKTKGPLRLNSNENFLVVIGFCPIRKQYYLN